MATDRPADAEPAPATVGMRIFVASDAITFASLLGAYWASRLGSEGWALGDPRPDLTLGTIMTGLLLGASALLLLGARRPGAARATCAAASLLGAGFLAGAAIEIAGLHAAGLDPRGSVAAGFFLVLSLFHAAHVAAGVAMLATRALKPGSMRPVALFWHVVDGLWLFIFGSLYLV